MRRARSAAVGANSAPILANGLIYLGTDDGDTRALDWTNGTQLFLIATKASVRSSPIVADGRLVFASNDNQAHEFQVGP